MPSLSQLTEKSRYTGFARLPYLDIDSVCFIWIAQRTRTRFELLNGKLARLAMTANGLVDSSIGTTADEADNLVAVNDPNFALISHVWPNSSIRRVWGSHQ